MQYLTVVFKLAKAFKLQGFAPWVDGRVVLVVGIDRNLVVGLQYISSLQISFLAIAGRMQCSGQSVNATEYAFFKIPPLDNMGVSVSFFRSKNHDNGL